MINYSFVGPDATKCSFYRAFMQSSYLPMVKDVKEMKGWIINQIFSHKTVKRHGKQHNVKPSNRWFVAKIKRTLKDYKVTNPSVKRIIIMKKRLKIGILVACPNFPSMKIVINIVSKKIVNKTCAVFMVEILGKPKEESFHCQFLLTNGTTPEETHGVYIFRPTCNNTLTMKLFWKLHKKHVTEFYWFSSRCWTKKISMSEVINTWRQVRLKRNS